MSSVRKIKPANKDRLLTVFESFHGALEQFLSHEKAAHYIDDSLEELRFLNTLGFMALDALLTHYWRHRVLVEWSDFLTLTDAILDSDDEISRLSNACGENLNRGQVVSSIRYIANTGEPTKFSPTFADVGIAMLILNGYQNPPDSLVQAVHSLLAMQKIRNSCFHTGRDFGEEMAKEGLFLYKNWIESAASLDPCLSFLNELESNRQRQAA